MARVTVNRLWQHLFGRGLVGTPNDFGRTGALPSHPQLLDWLASEFIRQGWRIKPLQELLLSSAAYQQRSGSDSTAMAADPNNTLFMRRVPQRLEAEAIRDALLAVSGRMDAARFGPGTLDESSLRRSIYFTVKRSQLVNSMVAFDAPEPLTSQGSRPSTTVAPQALWLMNSPQIRDWMTAMAKRVEADVPGEGHASKVVRVFVLALGRPPTKGELDDATTFLKNGTLVDLCQAVVSLNEFIYVY